MSRFLSTPSGWRATEEIKAWLAAFNISIHALRVEGDRTTSACHAYCKIFLSTPSGWRATRQLDRRPCGEPFLSTPSGWRATAAPYIRRCAAQISIHALRVEGDSRAPDRDYDNRISIHALRVEGDYTSSIEPDEPPNFYPRPPGGGRRVKGRIFTGQNNFYPRPPGGGRHRVHQGALRPVCHFYPRPPGGGRRCHVKSSFQFRLQISIHALRVEGDADTIVGQQQEINISIHALRVEGDGRLA